MTTTEDARRDPSRVPIPRWLIRGIWRGHRALYRLSRGRLGLGTPVDGGHFGTLRLRTTGRRTGKERAVMLGYLEHGRGFVVLAMNGWSEQDPAWWLNLQALPEAEVDLPHGTARVRAREAIGREREELWQRLRRTQGYGKDFDAMARLRPAGSPVVVLDPIG